MQKTLEIYLREQREKIASQILASYEPQENDEKGVWAQALEHCAKIVLSGDGDDQTVDQQPSLDLDLDTDVVNNVIKLPTRTRPSDTRE